METTAGEGRMPEGGGGTDHTKSSQNINLFLSSGLSDTEQGMPKQTLSSQFHRNFH